MQIAIGIFIVVGLIFVAVEYGRARHEVRVLEDEYVFVKPMLFYFIKSEADTDNCVEKLFLAAAQARKRNKIKCVSFVEEEHYKYITYANEDALYLLDAQGCEQLTKIKNSNERTIYIFSYYKPDENSISKTIDALGFRNEVVNFGLIDEKE